RIPKSGGMIHRDPGFVRFNDPKIITGRGLLSDLWAKKIYAICAKLEQRHVYNSNNDLLG
ncbi:MAG: hypothetical protein ACFCD0_26945, partial [Gemmataceae bacterium]